METGIINGFVLWEKAFDKNAITIVFPCCKRDIPKMTVSVYSLLETMTSKLNYDILVLSENLDEVDISRIQSIALGYNNVKIRIADIKCSMKIPYIKISTSLGFEKGIILFLPFILKRYSEVMVVTCGTIFLNNLYMNAFKQEDVVCYTEGAEVLAIKYNLENCRKRISAKIIADVSNEMSIGSIVEMIKKIYAFDIEINSSELTFLYAMEEGKFNSIFWKYAKQSCYYETLLYNSIDCVDIEKAVMKEDYYLFPFEKVTQGADIVLYGAGKVGKQYRKQILLSKYCNITAVVDSKYDWYQKQGEQVQPLTFLLKSQYDFVVIAIANKTILKTVKNDLLSMGVEHDKIIAQTDRELEV